MSSDFPKISIVTPSFNQAEFLEETIKSVLNQEYPNLEYIIIDGGSTDGSVDIIKKYEDKLYFWCSEPDKGQYDAINKGFTKSSGEIMGWINSDDIYFPWTLKTIGNIMSHLTEVKWLSSLMPTIIDHAGYCININSTRGFSKEAFLDEYYGPSINPKGWISQESTFWRRSIWDKAGSQISTIYHDAGDFFLWAEFYKYEKLYGTKIPLACFRRHNLQKTTQIENYIVEALEILSYIRKYEKCNYNYLKKTIQKISLCNIPFLRSLLRNLYMYKSYVVDRQNVNSKNNWKITEYYY
jgi:glycosyltransferase involved in cell wall biosynthesis